MAASAATAAAAAAAVAAAAAAVSTTTSTSASPPAPSRTSARGLNPPQAWDTGTHSTLVVQGPPGAGRAQQPLSIDKGGEGWTTKKRNA